MKQKYIDLYTDFAHRIAEMSHARRLKVGAVIVKDDVVTYGYNGMPNGWDNDCEDETVALYSGYEGAIHHVVLKTKPEVLHAESNALSKIARSTISAKDADMFITHSPCIDCAKMMFQAGVRRVFYSTQYSSSDGIEFLKKSGIEVVKLTNNYESV